jgi:hypothetical protein
MLSIGGGGRGSRQPHIGEAELDVGVAEGEAVAAGGGREIWRLHTGEAELGVGLARERKAATDEGWNGSRPKSGDRHQKVNVWEEESR